MSASKNYTTICIVILSLLMACQPADKKEPLDLLKAYPSSIGTKEKPQARLAYELKFLVDPATQEVPKGIFKREAAFVDQMSDNSNTLRTADLNWKSVGPANIGGRTRAAGIDQRNSDILMVGSVTGGLWRSTNQGESWRMVSNPNTINGVTALVQDKRPGKEDTWYYGTGELTGNSARASAVTPFRGDGIFKSVDNGLTWTVLSSTTTGDESVLDSPFKYTMKLIINHNNRFQDEVYAAVFGGIVRSVNGGNNWSVALDASGSSGSSLESLVSAGAVRYTDVQINEEGQLFAALSSATNEAGYVRSIPGIFTSVDGENWRNITPPDYATTRDRAVLALNNEGDELFVFTESRDFGVEEHQLWKYFTATDSWINLTANLPSFEESGVLNTQSSYNMMLAVNPANEEQVFLGATNLYRSSDGFKTRTNIDWIGGYSTDGSFDFYLNHHADQHNLLFFDNQSNKALSCTDGGVHLTENIGSSNVSWRQLNNGYVSSQFYALAQDINSFSSHVIGGMQDNGTAIRQVPGSLDWQDIAGGDGGYSAITNNGNTIYFSFQFGRIFRGNIDPSNGRTSFARIDPSLGGENEAFFDFINPFILDPSNPSVMYLIQQDRIWKNTNLNAIPGGSQETTLTNWEALGYTRTFGDEISTLEMSEHNSSILYYGTSLGSLYRVDGVDEIFGRRTIITQPEFPDQAMVASISANPINENELAVAFSNYNVPSIFYSSDGGLTFKNISGSLEENTDGSGDGPSVRWVEIVPLSETNKIIFAGTSSGLFSTEDIESDEVKWVKESEDMIGRSIVRMMSYRLLDGRMLVATHGQGIYETQIETEFTQSNVDLSLAIQRVYPNVFLRNDLLTIDFAVPEDGKVIFQLATFRGKIIARTEAEFLKGQRTFQWRPQTTTYGLHQLYITSKDQTIGTRVILSP